MQKLAVTLVCLGFLFVAISALDPPNPTSTVTMPSTYTFQYTTVIGQNNTGNTGSNYIAPNTFYSLQGITWFAQSNYSYLLGGPGLLTTDNYFYRALFFNQNNLNFPQTYNAIFGAPNGTQYGNNGFYSIDYSPNGIYALDYNSGSVQYWNFTGINVANNNAYPNPSGIFGNYTSETTGNSFTAIDSAYKLATKKSTGEIFVADYGCSRIVVYPPTANNQNSAPSYTIGQNDTVQCDEYTCSSYSPTTCLSSPTWMTFDCYDGLWVYNYDTMYYFPNNSKVATFAFNATDDLEGYFTDAHGLAMGPGCNAITFQADEGATFVIYITYQSLNGIMQPISANSYAAFGEAFQGSATADYTTTNTLNSVYGLAYGPNNTVYVSDYDNSRVVSFNLNSIVTGNSVAPSGVAASTTSTRSYSPIPLSSGASQSNYPSPTSYASQSNSPFVGEGSQNSASNSPFYYYTGAASQMSSWVNLF